MHPCAHSWLDVESIAGSILAVPDRLIVFCPTHASLPPCSPPSKVRPREVGHCGVVCATADLDGVCARRRSKSARSGRRNGYRIEQRNRQECKHLSCQLFMVTIREGDSGRPSPSVLNNPASSPQLPCSGLLAVLQVPRGYRAVQGVQWHVRGMAPARIAAARSILPVLI